MDLNYYNFRMVLQYMISVRGLGYVPYNSI